MPLGTVCKIALAASLSRLQEFFDRGDHPQSNIIYGQFLVSSAKGSTFLEPTDDPFDQVPPTVGSFVEDFLPRLILACRDDRLDVTSPQPPPDMRVAPTFVPRQLGGPIRYPWASAEEDAPHQGLEGRGFMLLARRQIDPQHDTAIGYQEVHFGAEATARVSQRMFRRLLELRRLGPAQARNDVRIFFSPHPRLGWREQSWHRRTTTSGPSDLGVPAVPATA